MISAKEARENYDKYGSLANKFIEKYIEPKIISASLSETKTTIGAVGKWYQGYTLKFPLDFKDGNSFDDVTLTDAIIDELKSNGYEVEFYSIDWNTLNELHDSEGTVAIISWKEVM